MNYFIRNPHKLKFFDELSALKELVFLTASEEDGTQKNTITIPKIKWQLFQWETLMRKVRHLKTITGFAKWMDLRASIALSLSQDLMHLGAEDEVDGYPIMGPAEKLPPEHVKH